MNPGFVSVPPEDKTNELPVRDLVRERPAMRTSSPAGGRTNEAGGSRFANPGFANKVREGFANFYANSERCINLFYFEYKIYINNRRISSFKGNSS